jgi:tRNA(fMet)-specific endonuclease VapC
MTRYILDTDHLSLLKHGHPIITSKVSLVLPEKIFVTIVTIEEQIRGRLAVISKVADRPEKFTGAYDYLFDSLQDFYNLQILRLDPLAARYFQELRQQKVRIGSQDLKIASIALSQQAIIVTRNNRDFEKVPNLQIEDWSIE